MEFNRCMQKRKKKEERKCNEGIKIYTIKTYHKKIVCGKKENEKGNEERKKKKERYKQTKCVQRSNNYGLI